MSNFAVRTLLSPSGERLPLMLDRSSGMPVYYPNLYVLTVLRQTNRSSATIERALREIIVLYNFLIEEKIDLNERINSGNILTLGEIDGLARCCRQSAKLNTKKNIKRNLVLRLEASRKAHCQMVSHTTSANRLRTIHAYLTWLVMEKLGCFGLSASIRARLEWSAENLLPVLRARIPVEKGRETLGDRMGLSSGVLEQLKRTVDPASPKNPWKSEFVRHRNALIMSWLLELGLRRGELLNVKISDIDFRKNEVMIARRADDKEDPRRAQPKVKTRSRILPLSVELASLTHKYIIEKRIRINGARKHRYLFVSELSGLPMSLSSVNKIFDTIKLRVEDIPDDLCPHVMRHTWNDKFSEIMDANRINEAREMQMRSYLMGWAPTSSTAAVYTKRFVRKMARQASVEMQSKILEINNNE